MEIILERFGRIPDEVMVEIQTVMKDCYQRLSPHGLEIVDVMVFENSSRMEAHTSEERNALGAYPAGLDADFVATHEAWTGLPRIKVCYARYRELSPLLRAAILRHEVAHSVLHGSPEYYIFPIPNKLLEASDKHSLPRSMTVNILYLISIGVKDYEALKLLLDHQYVEDQVAYSLHVSRTEKDDLEAWDLSRGDSKKELFCLVGRFKDLACVAAVADQKGWRDLESSPAEKELEYLPKDMRKRLAGIAWALTRMDSYDTYTKVEIITDLVIRNLMEQVFRKK